MTDGMEVSLLSHLTNSALVVYGLKWLRGTKRYQRCVSKLPLDNGTVHRLASLLGASASAIGMHGAVEGDASVGWHLALSIPPLWILLHSLWDIGQQFALNQLVFAIAVQEKSAAPVLTVPVAPDVTVTAALPKQETP